MIVKGIPQTVGGANVIAYTNAKTVKAYFGETDLSSLARWYEEDPNAHHLGMINLFRGIENYPVPMYMGMIKNGATISVNGPNGTFRYDMPVSKSFELQTVADTSNQYKPGQDGGIFEIVLSHKFEPGDVLTYSAKRGCQIFVSGEWEVRNENGGWRHFVKLVSMDKFKYFPKEYLKPGVKYWKVGHGMGEYSTQYSSMFGEDRSGSVTCEFQLGNHRGVETTYTMYAGMKNFSGATVDTQNFIEEVNRRMAQMKQLNDGTDVNIAILAKAKIVNGKAQSFDRAVKPMVATTLEAMCLAELGRLEANQLMWQKAGVIKDNNSIIRLNEGLYHQLKRGFTISYGRKNGITKAILRQAADYVFRNSDIPVLQRRMKFRCGFHAFNNMSELFSKEIYGQLNYVPGKLLGDDRLINNPISGPNTALSMGPIMFKSVFLDGIGMVDIEHDSSLDYEQMADRRTLVFGEYSPSSWSMIMEDVTSSEYSNAYASKPVGGEMTLGNMNNNVFYVKPEGPSLFWGNQRGRWSSASSSDILASHAAMDETFWCHSMSACWVMDNSKFLLIELQETDL